MKSRTNKSKRAKDQKKNFERLIKEEQSQTGELGLKIIGFVNANSKGVNVDLSALGCALTGLAWRANLSPEMVESILVGLANLYREEYRAVITRGKEFNKKRKKS